jgi:catechol 2,3-dioxygenase-like lactoylglutathione lyase family enzyme
MDAFMKPWYSRPVFFVRDTPSALAFYVERLGFLLDWQHDEDGRALVCQVRRDGLELILSQDPDRAGRGRVFISIDEGQTRALKADIERRKLPVREAHWGMPVLEILDEDDNELCFSPPG